MTYNKNKNQIIRVGFLALSTFFMMFWVSCNNNLNANEELLIIEHELYDGATIQVTLDPNYVHESLNFDSMEEYDNFGVALEVTGKVTVNNRLWNELSHAFDPIEIHKFDMKRSVVVDNIKYTADREALYSLDLSVENTETKLEVFYGESGEEDLIEIEKVFKSQFESKDFQSYHFKNPKAKNLYYELNSSVEKRGSDNEIFMNNFHSGSDCSSSCSQVILVYPEGQSPYTFRYRLHPSGPIMEAHIGHVLWNQSHRSGIRKRSRGGTITIIDRLDGNNFQVMGNNSTPIGPYHANGSLDTSSSSLQTYVLVQGRTSSGGIRSSGTTTSTNWTARRGSVKRGGGGTQSYHRARVRMNNSNLSVDIYPDSRFVP